MATTATTSQPTSAARAEKVPAVWASPTWEACYQTLAAEPRCPATVLADLLDTHALYLAAIADGERRHLH